MDRQSDCSSSGFIDVERGKTTFVQGRSVRPEVSPRLSCTLQFAPQTRGDMLKMWFENAGDIGDCDVSLSIEMSVSQV